MAVLTLLVLQSYYLDAVATLAEAFHKEKIAASIDQSFNNDRLGDDTSLDSRILSAALKGNSGVFKRSSRRIALNGGKDALQDMEEMTSLGHDLMDLVDGLNGTFAWLTPLEVLLDICVLTIGIFLFSSIFTGISVPDTLLDKMYFACTPLLGLNLALGVLYRFLLLCRSGQKLQEQLAGAREMLAQQVASTLYTCNRYPDEQVFEHLALTDRMREDGSLAPGGYFELNNGLFSSAFSTVVNYLLVLIAFKIDLA